MNGSKRALRCLNDAITTRACWGVRVGRYGCEAMTRLA